MTTEPFVGFRNKFGEPVFSTDDFIALELFAGKTPPLRGTATQYEQWHGSAASIARRLEHVALCDQFNTEYFDPRYPYAKWVDFYREYQVWCAWKQEIKRDETISDIADDLARRASSL